MFLSQLGDSPKNWRIYPVATRTRSKTMISTSESQKITVQNNSKQSPSIVKSPVEGAFACIIVQPILRVSEIWNNDNSLLPAYFFSLKKCFEISNTIDENMRFVCWSNVMSPSKAEAYNLALSRTSGNIEPYAALKKFYFIVCFY